METYWQQFTVIYDLIKSIGFTGIQYLLGAIFIFGVLRSIYKYAGGHPVGRPSHSVWSFRFFDWLAVTAGWAPTTEFTNEHGSYDPIGFNLLGILIDILVIGIIISLSILIWPAVVFALLTFVPLQLCRNHNLRKRKFIAELKGEEVIS